MDLFDTERAEDACLQTIKLKDAELLYMPNFLANDAATEMFFRIKQEVEWEQVNIQMYGKSVPIPRLSAWYGDAFVSYTYSGLTSVAKPWTRGLESIKKKVEALSGNEFNSVLVNLYRDGNDSVSWHADDEPELGDMPVIASVSLGCSRNFQLKHRFDSSQKFQISLEPGSLLVMKEGMQRAWLHQVPKTRRRVGERINLTFRKIV